MTSLLGRRCATQMARRVGWTARIAASPAPATPLTRTPARSLYSSPLNAFAAATPAATPTAPLTSPLFPGHSFHHLHLDSDSTLHTLTVRMSRPDLHNAFNEVLIAEIRTVFDAIAKGSSAADSPLSSLRAVILTGAGASFSAGADLSWMKKMRTYTQSENEADSRLLFGMFASIASCPVPTIARVNGSALGGGVGLVSACDIVISHAEAKFGLTEVKLGLAPAVISSFVMSKLTAAATNFYFLTGSRFDAAEAMRIGLVNQVAQDDASLDAAVKKVVEELALNLPKAVRATKSLISHIRRDPRILESEPYVTKLIASLRVSQEGQEGLASFFEKRKANWIPAHLGNPKPKK